MTSIVFFVGVSNASNRVKRGSNFFKYLNRVSKVSKTVSNVSKFQVLALTVKYFRFGNPTQISFKSFSSI